MAHTRNTVEFNKLEVKDHYEIKVNGVSWGVWEKSDIRHFIEEWDKQINA